VVFSGGQRQLSSCDGLLKYSKDLFVSVLDCEKELIYIMVHGKLDLLEIQKHLKFPTSVDGFAWTEGFCMQRNKQGAHSLMCLP